ncbi:MULTISPECIES: MFS transporter [unclassified Microbacterium]|uniref:MFS transporter n=1 Tax=unclassified Microbacterium TaxID=2609290 RepID=UPI0012F82FB1|nr:MFS transporter [Microbacterium sp. MAH-37]
MSTPSRLWSNSRYVTWLVSDTAKALGGGLATFALPLIALQVTGEPAQAGIIGAVGMVVILFASLYGGVLADRHDRVRLMVMGAGIGGALIAGMTVLIVTGSLNFAVLLGVEIVLSTFYGLFDIAGESVLKDIVPADALGRAQAANQARDAILRLGATPLGGVLLATGAWLIGVAMLVSSAVEAIAAVALGRMRRTDRISSRSAVPDRRTERRDDEGSTTAVTARSGALAEIREGVSWLMRRRDLRPILFTMTAVNLGFSTATTTIIYLLQQRGESPAVIGLLGSAIGAATLIGALLATPLVSRVRAGTITIVALVLPVATVGILPFTDSVPVMIAAPAIALLFTPPLNAALLGYSMVAIPTELVGRVRSAMTVIVSGAMPLAPLIAGAGLSTVGPAVTLGIAALLCAATFVLALCTPALRSLPAEAGWAAHAAKFTDAGRVPASVR